MATLRRKMRVSWEGHEPVEILTTARDLVLSPYDGANPSAVGLGQVHAALVRQGHEPPRFEQWLELVDEVEDLSLVVTDIGDPTTGAPSDGVLLRSPA